jgi:hypothetical protein
MADRSKTGMGGSEIGARPWLRGSARAFLGLHHRPLRQRQARRRMGKNFWIQVVLQLPEEVSSGELVNLSLPLQDRLTRVHSSASASQ